jgi:hypothetical protein
MGLLVKDGVKGLKPRPYRAAQALALGEEHQARKIMYTGWLGAWAGSEALESEFIDFIHMLKGTDVALNSLLI